MPVAIHGRDLTLPKGLDRVNSLFRIPKVGSVYVVVNVSFIVSCKITIASGPMPPVWFRALTTAVYSPGGKLLKSGEILLTLLMLLAGENKEYRMLLVSITHVVLFVNLNINSPLLMQVQWCMLADSFIVHSSWENTLS
jgi:hypothetical protein